MYNNEVVPKSSSPLACCTEIFRTASLLCIYKLCDDYYSSIPILSFPFTLSLFVTILFSLSYSQNYELSSFGTRVTCPILYLSPLFFTNTIASPSVDALCDRPREKGPFVYSKNFFPGFYTSRLLTYCSTR